MESTMKEEIISSLSNHLLSSQAWDSKHLNFIFMS